MICPHCHRDSTEPSPRDVSGFFANGDAAVVAPKFVVKVSTAAAVPPPNFHYSDINAGGNYG